jgi:serpin B
MMIESLLAVALAASAPEMSMRDADTQFATHLYAQLRGGGGNLIFSPASIRIALAMAFAGARGETASEMQHALVLPSTSPHEGFAASLKGWAALADPAPNPHASSSGAEMQRYYEAELERRRIVLHVVNRLWAQTGHHFQDDFLALLRDAYRAPLAELNFHAQPEPSRVAINGWVSDQTAKKIPELIAPRLITAETRLVVTNAVYFKAQWQAPFQPEATRVEPFFAAGGNEVKAHLMHMTRYFSLGAFDGGQLLELPYASGELAMDVVLPSAPQGLPKLEEELGHGAWPRWIKALSPVRVDVSIPRFKMSSAFGLAEALGALGMKQAFVFPKADFSGMDGTRELFIGSVVHQAMVDVDEQGTEAAAATAVLMAAGAAPPTQKPVVFRADHPFLFFIRDTRSGVILFAGRVVDPS